MLSDKTAKVFIIIGTTIVVAIFAIWQVLWFSGWDTSAAIADGIKIGGYDVGGYDKKSAVQMLDIQLKNKLGGKKLEISYDGIKSSLNLEDFTQLTFENAVQEAYSTARSGNLFADYMALAKAKLLGRSLDYGINFNDETLSSKLKEISGAYYIQAKDASIISFDPSAQAGQRLSISPQESGRELDIQKTALEVKDAVISEKNNAEAYVKETQPNLTEDFLMELDSQPIISEYTINNISGEYENAIYQVLGSGRYEIMLPGSELSIIEFMGGEDYIYFEMPDGGTGSEYEKVLTQDFPTQIFMCSVLSELDITERRMYDFNAKNLPAGASCITNQYYDLKIANNLSCPVIIRVGYKRVGAAGQIYCEVYRPSMEYKTLLRSVIKPENQKTVVDIIRVYVDNEGNAIDSVVADTVEIKEKNDDGE